MQRFGQKIFDDAVDDDTFLDDDDFGNFNDDGFGNEENDYEQNQNSNGNNNNNNLNNFSTEEAPEVEEFHKGRDREAILFVVDCDLEFSNVKLTEHGRQLQSSANSSELDPFFSNNNVNTYISDLDRAATMIDFFIKHKIVTSKEDKISIILYNCKQVENMTHSPGIYVLNNFTHPSTGMITSLRKCFSPVFRNRIVDMKRRNPNSKRENISLIKDVFLLSTQMFQTQIGPIKKTPNLKRRVLILTANDTPVELTQIGVNDYGAGISGRGGPGANLGTGDFEIARTRVEDALSNELEFELYPCGAVGQFDQGKVWKRLIENIEVDDEEGGQQEQNNLNDNLNGTEEGDLQDLDSENLSQNLDGATLFFKPLYERIRKRVHKQRTLGRLPLWLDDNRTVCIGVSIYANLIEAKLPSPIWLHSEDFAFLETRHMQFKKEDFNSHINQGSGSGGGSNFGIGIGGGGFGGNIGGLPGLNNSFGSDMKIDLKSAFQKQPQNTDGTGNNNDTNSKAKTKEQEEQEQKKKMLNEHGYFSRNDDSLDQFAMVGDYKVHFTEQDLYLIRQANFGASKTKKEDKSPTNKGTTDGPQSTNPKGKGKQSFYPFPNSYSKKFTKSQVRSGLLFAGFTSQTHLKPWMHISHSYCVSHCEERVSGSAEVFAGVLNSMRKKSLCMLCWFQPRVNAEPRFCALVPGLENSGVKDALQLIPLPFQEDVRKETSHKVNDVKHLDVSQDAPLTCKAAKLLLKWLQLKHNNDVDENHNEGPGNSDGQSNGTLNLNYHPCDVSNPTISKFYANLQALALKQDRPDDVADEVMPDEMQFKPGSMTCKFIQAFNKSLPDLELHRMDRQINEAMKRCGMINQSGGIKRGGGGEEGGSKKQKLNDGTVASSSPSDTPNVATIDEIRNRIQNNDMTRMKISELKDFLKSMRRKTTGNKLDLIRECEKVVMQIGNANGVNN